MTVSSSTSKAGPFDTNGVQTAFTFTFKCNDKNDLIVILADVDSVESELVLDSDYTVTLNADQDVSPGGTVNTATAYPTNQTITILRSILITQGTALTNFRPSVVESALDKLTLICQQLAEAVGRAVKVNVSNTSGASADELVNSLNAAAVAAAGSATAASSSASLASGSANAASTHASNALTRANNAATSAANAASSASNAATSAANVNSTIASAVSSATAAANTSANVAAANASSASNSANAAANSAAAAANTASQTVGVNVKTFGAVGNGVVNDTAAIQAAINSISSGTVVFPTGNYRTSGIILKPNVRLVGVGLVTLTANGNNVFILRYQNTTGVLTANFYIDNFTFNTGGFSGVYAVHLNGVNTGVRISNIHLSRLEIVGTFARGIDLVMCANVFATDIFMISVIMGFHTYVCTDVDVNNTKVQSGSGQGFYIQGGVAGPFDEGYRLTNCSTNGQAVGLVIEGCDWGCVSNCSFTTCSVGCLVINSTANNWKFSNCEFAAGVFAAPGANYGVACYFHQFNNCLFSNNTFGLNIRGDSHTLTGCVFNANSNVDLFLNATTGYSVVSGNVFNSSGNPVSIAHAAGGTAIMCTNNLHKGTINLVGTNTQVNNQAY